MIKEKDIKNALDKFIPIIQKQIDIVGAGCTLKDKEICLTVYTENELTMEERKTLPEVFEGFKVIIEKIGKIEPQ